MLFVNYADILPKLITLGIVEVEDENDLVRLEINPDLPDSALSVSHHPSTGSQLHIHHISDPSSQVLPYPEAGLFSMSAAELPEVLDRVLSKLHLPDLLVIPVGVWRDVIDSIAFDLAADPNWTEIDAMAALHQNTRNALAVPRSETPVLINMIRALLNNAQGPQHDLIITSDSTLLLIELFHDGALSITSEFDLNDQITRAPSSSEG